MKCPFCDGDEDRVIDSRPAREGSAIRRRRECLKCGRRFTTYEFVEETGIFVLKSNGSREPFDRMKILKGIQIACTKRPVSLEQIEEIVTGVEAKVLASDGHEISSSQIGEWVMDGLRATDEVAYVRFASVYRRFDDVDQFVRELQTLGHPVSNSSQSN